MKKIVCLMSLLSLISCGKSLSIASFLESNPANAKSTPSDYKNSEELKIYLSEKDIFVDVSTINRANFYLNLSDKIVFSDKDKDKTEASVELKGLEKIEENKDLKVKVSSFCFYKNEEIENNTDKEPVRAVQELGSQSYHSSFSVFELIPKEILLNGLDETFYCSFVLL